MKWAFDFLNGLHNSTAIAQAIINRTCLAVSDGSLKSPVGTAAFALVGATDDHIIQGVHLTPGPILDGNSFRCEISGLLAVVYLSQLICTFYGITEGAIQVICDNKTALTTFQSWFTPDPNHDSFDLISSLRASLATSPLTWSTQHVYGHRDKTGTHLTRFEALNVKMDHLANQYRSSHTTPADTLPINVSLLDEG